MAENETITKMDIHFRPKNENVSRRIILVFFHTFSHQVSPTLRCQYLVQFRLFLQEVLVDEIPLSSCTVHRYLCGIFFLDDISTREQLAFLVYCYRLKAIFHNLCIVFYRRLCGLS